MLQKEPELRPSADEIFTSRLPQLLQRFQNEDDPAIFSDDEQDAKTKAKWVGLDHVTVVSIHVGGATIM